MTEDTEARSTAEWERLAQVSTEKSRARRLKAERHRRVSWRWVIIAVWTTTCITACAIVLINPNL